MNEDKMTPGDWQNTDESSEAHLKRARKIVKNLDTYQEREKMCDALFEAMLCRADKEAQWLGDYLLAAIMVFELPRHSLLPSIDKEKLH